MKINTLFSLLLATLSTGVTSTPIPNADPESQAHGSIQSINLDTRSVHNVDPLRKLPDIHTRSLDLPLAELFNREDGTPRDDDDDDDTLYTLLTRDITHDDDDDDDDNNNEEDAITNLTPRTSSTSAQQTIEETSTYQLFSKVHSSMTKDNYYAFTVKYTTGDGPGDASPKDVLAEAQRDYGFDHIALVVGKVSETTSKKKVKRDFIAVLHHLIITEYPETIYQKRNWSGAGGGKSATKIEFVKQTAAKKDAALAAKAKDYFAQAEHQKWVAKTNDCLTFVRYLEGYL
ncbi:hypothetical protein BO82DRAFT_403723 [Aspergillus uvarum CBS 121591]|uniref:Uncharacterized protein n=1 Tax=Aspergillus uvarum CBS 121591 TaxID=1448315 RepID=A0A319C211_9EURO|nr:hypothetical protein BO82DRAFT_403723 [Aspergillus uvarum CBS 121591]PYH80046.1 hypothetical protein BO82DRAFT_403723 [Aspergillus uvarum CBS 121591]